MNNDKATELLERTHGAVDAILRGKHAGWDQALAALRKELREALECGNE